MEMDGGAVLRIPYAMGVSSDLSTRGGAKSNGGSVAGGRLECLGLGHRVKPARRNLADFLGGEFGQADLIQSGDWASLIPELVEDIAGRLLSVDVAEYLRLRAACKRWRECTIDPIGAQSGLDSRFRPRNWIVLSHCAAGTTRRRLLNLATAARADVDLPALSNHHHLGCTDGLLVLCDRATEAVRLLNPLTGILTDFPAINSCVSIERRPKLMSPAPSWCTDIVDHSVIDGAGIDDSTSPPTLFLCLRGLVRWIVCARPGDQHWLSIGPYNFDGQILYQSLLSLWGRTYITTHEGSIKEVDLHHQPYPQLDCIIDETSVKYSSFVGSYLVRSEDAREGILMVRYISNLNAHPDFIVSEWSGVFVAEGTPRCIQVFEVDLAGRRLIPVKKLGRRALILGQTQSLLLSTETFPSLASNTVYLSFRLQAYSGFSVYHLDPDSSGGERVEPVHKFVVSKGHKVSPSKRPCSLDDYLVCYVDRARMLFD